ATSTICPWMARFGSHEWLVKSMLPSRWFARTGAMTRSSVSWISAAPSAGSSSAHRARVSTWPPLTATISPRAMARRAKRPRPWIGLGRTSVAGARQVRSATGGQRLDEGVRPVGRDQPRLLGAPLDPHEAVQARDVHSHQAAARGPEPPEAAPEPARAYPHAPADLAAQRRLVEDARVQDAPARDLAAAERPGDLDRIRPDGERARPEPEPGPDVHGQEERGRDQHQARGVERADREGGGQRQEKQGEEQDRRRHRGQTVGHATSMR